MKSLWYGPFGVYEVPAAILWLADEANRRVGIEGWLEWLAGNNIRLIRRALESPGYKVVSDWGKWRDAQEEARHVVTEPTK